MHTSSTPAGYTGIGLRMSGIGGRVEEEEFKESGIEASDGPSDRSPSGSEGKEGPWSVPVHGPGPEHDPHPGLDP